MSLVERLKEVFKHSIIYGLTSSLQSLLGFVMLPILTAYYTPEEFGVYSILLLLSALASSIFYLGASSSLGRFYFEEDSKNYRKQIITTSIIVAFFGAFVLILLGSIFSTKLSILIFNNSKYASPIIYILIATAFGFLLNLMTLMLRYENQSILFFKIIISGVLMNFIISYILLAKFNYGLLAPIYGLLFSNVISFIFLLLIRVKILTRNIRLKHFKIILNFGIQSSITGLLFYVLDWVDRLILKDLLNLGEVGVYSLGYRLGSIMNIFVIMPFSLVWAPFRMKYSKNQDTNVFTGKVLSYYTLIGVIVVILTIFIGEDIIQFFFTNKEYKAAFSILPIIMMSQLFFGYQNIVDYGIYLHKKNYLYIIVSIISILLNVYLNYWLIPIFGITGAAYVTLITYLFSSSFIFILSNRYVSIDIEKYRVLSALAIVPILNLIFKLPILNTFPFKIISFLLVAIVFYKFWLNKSERNYIVKAIEPIYIRTNKHI